MTTQIAKPNLTDILLDVKDDIFKFFNCHRIGRITKFNAALQVADIEIVDKGVIETDEGNVLIDFPLLVDCPVVINAGPQGGIKRPILVGEYCIVHFNDRDIDNWVNNGNIQEPNSDRRHNLTDCMVTVGLFPESSPLANYDNEATVLYYADNKIELKDGTVKITTNQGAEVNLDSLIEIKNTSQNLKALVDQLIDLVVSLQTVDPISGLLPVDPGTQASLNALKGNFAQLLK